MKTAHCLCFTVLAFGVNACVNHVPIEDGMPCPCADGYTCCAITNRCLPAGQVCQAGAGQSKWQPIASVSVKWSPTPTEPFLMGDRVTFWDAFNQGWAATYRFAQNDWLQQKGYWPGQGSFRGPAWCGRDHRLSTGEAS